MGSGFTLTYFSFLSPSLSTQKLKEKENQTFGWRGGSEDESKSEFNSEPMSGESHFSFLTSTSTVFHINLLDVTKSQSSRSRRLTWKLDVGVGKTKCTLVLMALHSYALTPNKGKLTIGRNVGRA